MRPSLAPAPPRLTLCSILIVSATSLLRFVCGSNFASVAVSALTPIQAVALAISCNGAVGLTAIGVSAQISCSLHLLLAVARRESWTSP
jgi:hypothetical protein